MLKQFIVLVFVFSTTLGQASNPLIPTDISQSCSTFLKSLNDDTTLSGCTTSLLTATKQFGPGGNATAASSSAISSAVDAICSSSTTSSCPDSLLRGKLVDFYSQCPEELTTKSVTGVIKIYEVLYALAPFRNAICSKDDNDNYCLLQKTNSSSSGVKTYVASQGNSQELLHNLYNDPSLKARAASSSITPNMTTFHSTNLLFFFLQPNMTEQELCTSCTRQIFMSYFNYETLVPYAPGLSVSQLLGGQMDLYKGIQNTCGPSFLQTNIQAAGGISGGTLFNSGNPVAQRPGTVALGLATLVITFFL